jgi:hypothetical protein
MKVSSGPRQPTKELAAVKLILNNTSQRNPFHNRLPHQHFVGALQQIELTAKK